MFKQGPDFHFEIIKRLFEISEVEIMIVDCFLKTNQFWSPVCGSGPRTLL